MHSYGENNISRSPLAGTSSMHDTDPLQVYQAGPTTVVGFGGRDLLDDVNLADCRAVKEAVSIPAEDGESWGLYFFAEWTHIHLEFTPNVDACVNGKDKNYWAVTDDEPRGTRETRTLELTGASRETDADNVARPVIGADPVMSIDYRFKETDETHCVEPGGSYTMRRSTLYRVGVSFEAVRSAVMTRLAMVPPSLYAGKKTLRLGRRESSRTCMECPIVPWKGLRRQPSALIVGRRARRAATAAAPIRESRATRASRPRAAAPRT